MAQTGYTPILIYSSTTASQAPSASNLTNSTLGSELAINITDGKLFYKDNGGSVQVIGWKVVPATAGGTGQTSYAVGDLLYADTTTSLAKLADVATGNALISGGVGVAPSWGKIGLTTHVSGTLPVGNGGTGLTTLTAGQIPYGNGTSAFSSSSSLYFSGTNFGVGTSSPSQIIHAYKGSSGATPQTNTQLIVENSAAAGISILSPDANAGRIHFGTASNSQNVTLYGQYNYGLDIYCNGSLITHFDTSTKDVTISAGNVIQGTAAKGINFTANTGAAGMTSQLLNWYEEGTFDPRLSFASGGDTCSYSGRTGRYTRIGRLVTVNIYLGLTAKGAGTGNVSLINLPFAAGSYSSAVPRVISMTSTGTVSAYIYSGQSSFTFFSVNTSGTETQITNTNITNSTEIVLTLSYIV